VYNTHRRWLEGEGERGETSFQVSRVGHIKPNRLLQGQSRRRGRTRISSGDALNETQVRGRFALKVSIRRDRKTMHMSILCNYDVLWWPLDNIIIITIPIIIIITDVIVDLCMRRASNNPDGATHRARRRAYTTQQ